ncbi:ribonuclease P protein subunit p29 [Vanessa tameamea]|uniref:Ribonuclease P protein subunit p29 n=1 Tax=Vanessa tameamea TaxID=334116 RepID=A0A8B8HW79_VANTA|nr:ribonuclease P protein subunit p29 [Vanessa tameamea]
MSNLEIKDAASQSIVNFLKTHAPKYEGYSIETELKKDFLLAKRKSKDKKGKQKTKKSKILTRNEKKALGFYSIPRNSIQYNDMLALNKVWSEYISQLLELKEQIPDSKSSNWVQFTQSFYRADFHGAMMEVVRSKCPSYVGKKGICVMDTKNTFKIVSEDNIVTTIPKKCSVFNLFIKDIIICIFGKLLCARPAERSNKKVKSYLHPDL